MKQLVSLKFNSPSEVGRNALRKMQQIRRNLEAVVAETTLLAITKIAMDTDVDTGRARASLAGELGEAVPIDGPNVSEAAIADGKQHSLTRLNLAELEGVVGSNLEYMPHLEFGHRIRQGSGDGKKRWKKDDNGHVAKVPGKAMFRKNIPVIRGYFHKRGRLAVRNGLALKPLGGE